MSAAPDTFVLLWSQNANAFRVATLQDALADNMRAYRDDQRSDWTILIVGSCEDCTATARAAGGTLVGRQQVRDAAHDAIERAKTAAADRQRVERGR